MEELSKLTLLGEKLDPFSSIDLIPSDCLEILKELKLDHLLNDPFKLSNEILKRLLFLEEQQRKQTKH